MCHAGSWCESASVCPRRGGTTQRSAHSHMHSCCLVFVCVPLFCPNPGKGRASVPACCDAPKYLLKFQNQANQVCHWSSCVGACIWSTNPGIRMEAQRPRPARSAALAAHASPAAPDGLRDCECVCVCLGDYSPSSFILFLFLLLFQALQGFMKLFLSADFKCSGLFWFFFSRMRRSWFCPCGPGSLLSTACAASPLAWC